MTKLFFIRERLGLDRSRLAADIGINTRTLFNHEHGKGGKASLLLREALARRLKVKIDTIFDSEGRAR